MRLFDKMARPGARIGADRAAGKGAFRRKLVRARRWLVLLMRCFAPLLFVAAVGGALPACSTDEASSRCPEPATVSLASLQEAIERAPRGSQCRKDLLRLLDAMSAGEEGTKSEGVLKSVLDLRRIGSQLEEMEAIARQSTEEPDALPKKRLERAPTVVLDPGHGGNEYGATSEGLRESHLALELAKRAAEMLREMNPEIEVYLTRDGDYRVSLEQRAELANAAGADVFISIHLNDAKGEIRRGGVTTFVLDASNDARLLERAARENGISIEEVSELSLLLASFDRGARVSASLRLAESLQRSTLRGGRSVLPHLHDRGVRRAAFQVLIGAKMPAVLLEASFLNVPEEREALRTERYKRALARGIARGILDYLYPAE